MLFQQPRPEAVRPAGKTTPAAQGPTAQCSVAQWGLTLCDPHELQHTRLPCPSLSPGVCSNSCPLMPSSHLIICHPLFLLPSIFPSIRVFSSESVLHIRWPKYWSFSVSSSSEHFSDWFDLLAVQGTLRNLFQHHSSKASVLWHSASLLSNSHLLTRLVEKP